MLYSQVTPAPVWFSQSVAVFICIYHPCLSDAMPLYLMIWLISFSMPIFVMPFCLSPPRYWLQLPSFVNQSMITAIKLISGVRPFVWHSTLPLFLFAAASSTFLLLLLKHRLPQNKRPSHSFSQLRTSLSQNNFDEWNSENLNYYMPPRVHPF